MLEHAVCDLAAGPPVYNDDMRLRTDLGVGYGHVEDLAELMDYQLCQYYQTRGCVEMGLWNCLAMHIEADSTWRTLISDLTETIKQWEGRSWLHPRH